MTAPQLHLSSLPLSDGSATYTAYGCSVTASVNGPVEVTRRDELPEEATIDVAVRPAAGIGGIRERHFETILHRVLRHVIRADDLPRTLLQITLQITTGIDQDATSGRSYQAESNLYILPLLLNAATLALLSTAIPLEITPVATILAVMVDGTLISTPSWKDIQTATSLHAFAFSTHAHLLMAESEGTFDIEAWEHAAEAAKQLCIDSGDSASDPPASETTGSLEKIIRRAVAGKMQRDRGWATHGP